MVIMITYRPAARIGRSQLLFCRRESTTIEESLPIISFRSLNVILEHLEPFQFAPATAGSRAGQKPGKQRRSADPTKTRPEKWKCYYVTEPLRRVV
jgi:hypothetical protein